MEKVVGPWTGLLWAVQGFSDVAGLILSEPNSSQESAVAAGMSGVFLRESSLATA